MNRTGQPRSLSEPVILWFRQDLRLQDNAALLSAAATGKPLLPIFILDEGRNPPWGGASRWWLHHSLEKLADDLQQKGLQLVLRRGDPRQILSQLAAETGARQLHANRLYEPEAAKRDAGLAEDLT